ncbi:conserved hypothetical protein [Trichormus variabilis ATCC 29413]|uniref:Uncharacterized protein n=1 Tax=Trichormus variabilis (strain ATCC 29413 / PCC 7937) TaxID=240292 RepID=Q3MCJ7_TRIV2|nr:conserved hypothetical protein [Trichormus variabilis ATCC 29413]QFZ12071.1 hypothetical protein EH233_08580 [Anabaena sp. YBS01]
MKFPSSAFIKQRIYSNKNGVKTCNLYERNIIDTNSKYVIPICQKNVTDTYSQTSILFGFPNFEF